MRPSLQPRHLLALTTVVLGMASAGGISGCGTDPVNPDGCKAIETARCQAAPACEAFPANFDVEACERFYRDQCLRGLQTESDPGQPRIDACVKAIERAGACANKGEIPCNLGTREVASPCTVVVSPELYSECGFLDDGFGEEDASVSPFEDAASDGPPDAATDAPPDGPLDPTG